MARVTVEDCLEKVPNRFALTVLASRRARALAEGRGQAQIDCENKEAVTALREIAEGLVRYEEDVQSVLHSYIDEQREQYASSVSEGMFLEAASLRGIDDDEDEESEESEGEDVKELDSDPERMSRAMAKDADDDDESDDSDADSEDSDSEDEQGESSDDDDIGGLDDADDADADAGGDDDDDE